MSANVISAFFETLVAQAGDYNAAVVGNLSIMDAVYMDVAPDVARAGETLQVYFPDLPAFAQQGANDWAPVPINPNFIPMVFNQNPGISILIRDFEQFQTATQIIKKFLDPAYKRGLEFFNGAVAGMITTANFNVNPVLQASGSQINKAADVATAWNALANSKVPLHDANDLFFLTHNDVYKNMMQDPTVTQENIVGALIALQTRMEGQIPNTFKMQQRWDQQMPKTVTAIGGTGTSTVTSGSPTVTVVGNVTGSVTIGQTYVVSSNDPNQVGYLVTNAVYGAPNTTLTLGSNYVGATSSAVTVSTRQYISVALHKYAIGCAMRPMPAPDESVVEYTTIWLKGIPFRVMLSYQHLKGGWLLTIDFGYALAVLRAGFGVILQS